MKVELDEEPSLVGLLAPVDPVLLDELEELELDELLLEEAFVVPVAETL